MPHYREIASRQDRAKAIAAVALVHVGLGAAILAGLNVDVVQRAVERLQTIDVRIDLPPPPPPPPPPNELSRPSDREGAAGKKAVPTPIVAPKPEVVLPIDPPVVASTIPSTGSAATAGAASAGMGSGAGGSGTGLGGGGRGGDGVGYTPAQRIQKIPDREYRRFVSISGMRRGRVGVTVKVNTDGRPSDCRIARSSGNSSADSLMCQLTVQYVRFRPARDPQGQPVAQDISWYPDWSPR